MILTNAGDFLSGKNSPNLGFICQVQIFQMLVNLLGRNLPNSSWICLAEIYRILVSRLVQNLLHFGGICLKEICHILVTSARQKFPKFWLDLSSRNFPNFG
jgi:hypothetical protein